MANHKSAEKRIRSSERKKSYNKRVKSILKTREQLLLKQLNSKNKADIQKNLNLVFSIIDKAKKSGVLHKKTANRKKSRLSLKIPQNSKNQP